MVDADRRGRPRAGIAEGGVDGAARRRGRVTGQWASTVPVDEAGAPGRRVPDVEGHRGAGTPASSVSAGPSRATRRARSPPGCGAPAASPSHRRRPDRPHAAPRPRPARGRGRGALVPRAGRLPDDALHRRRRRVARVDDRRLAHRQPRPRPRWPTTPSWSPGRRRRPTSCRRWSPAGSVVGTGAAPTSPPTSASRTTSRWSPACPTCTPRRWPRGAVHAAARPTWRSARPSWISCPVPVKKTDVFTADGRRSPASATAELPARQQPRHRRPRLRVAPRQVVAPDDGLVPGRATFDDLTALAATSPPGAGRRASSRRG